MFDRFSDAARRIVVLAQEQARRLRHDYIGTEHLLLGLLDEDHAASRILLEMQVRPAAVHQGVVEAVGKGRKPPRGHIPFTPRAKRTLEVGTAESIRLGSAEVDPHHLLLGMIAQADGVGAAILERLGVDLSLLRRRLIGETSPMADPADDQKRTVSSAARPARAVPRPFPRIDRDVPRPDVVETLLRDLPEWFGIEEAIAEYVTRSADLPTYTASLDGEPVGVLVLDHHGERVAEIYVLAARRRLHRQGVGRALLEVAERDLARAGTAYVQVKTLGASHPSPEYAATRAFYEALGYQALEEFPADTIWPGNPCLIMIKHLECTD